MSSTAAYAASGTGLEPPPTSAHDMLLRAPRGAYTAVLVCGGHLLADWEAHLQRLVVSLRGMHSLLDGFYGRNAAWAQASRRGCLGADVDPIILSISMLPTPPASLRVAHCTLTHVHPTCAPQAHGGMSGSDLQPLLLPTLRACLGGLAHVPSDARHALVLLLPPSRLQPHGFDVHAFVSLYAPLPICREAGPATAVVMGPPRKVAIAKDSGWVAARRRLEALRPPGATELLLASRDGRLLEGMVTNLFVVLDSAAAAAAEAEAGAGASAGPVANTAAWADTRPADAVGYAAAGAAAHGAAGGAASSSGSSDALEIWTAGLGEGVAWGTMRARVLCACATLGLRVRERGPGVAARRAWREAFLTNSLRGIQPLGRIDCDERNHWGLSPWSLELSPVPGPVTAAIAAAVVDAAPLTNVLEL